MPEAPHPRHEADLRGLLLRWEVVLRRARSAAPSRVWAPRGRARGLRSGPRRRRRPRPGAALSFHAQHVRRQDRGDGPHARRLWEGLVVDRGERVAGGDGPAELALFRNRAHDDAVRARPVVGGARDAQVECRRSEAAGAGRRCRDRDDEVARRDTRPDDARRRSRRRGARRAAHEAHRDGPRERAERSEHAVRLRPRVRRRGLVRRNARRVDDDDRA
mmetsp:Transcript_11583/g.46850  ORF Transcript_11583/g.46850 Transcript_11583/m.46850 type:complete len:218 (+) Transcript_11583:730-1383(+)